MRDTTEKFFNEEEAEIIEVYPEEEENQEEGIVFWFKEGNVTKINREQFLVFLERAGFRKLFIGKDYIFIRVENNVVKEVSTVRIKDYVANYVKDLGDDIEGGFSSREIWRKIINQVSNLFCKSFLELIPNLIGEFKRDTASESFIYFKNCFVRITKDGYEAYNYEELDGYIWESQKLKRDFHCSETKSVFEDFILRICRENSERYAAAKSVIGYLEHSFKDPANTKAIIFIDERIGDGANGRCGKSLVGKAIGKIRNVVDPGGKNFNFNRFMFQSIKPDTQIVFFNDVKKGFNFENLFSIITDDMPIEQKQKDQVIIPFENSPKILITTNYAMKGFDPSTLDREYVFEFSDHYNEQHKPIHEFGKNFFGPWTKEEWNSFYNFMIVCLQYYLENGLVEYERINLFDKILIESTSEDFVEFIEDIELDRKYDNKELYSDYIERYPEHKKDIAQKTLTGWVKTFAKIKGYKYTPKKSGKERGFILQNPKNGRMDEEKSEYTGEEDII